MEKVVILVPDNHTPKSAVMDVLSDMEKCADGRGHFQTGLLMAFITPFKKPTRMMISCISLMIIVKFVHSELAA